MKKSFILHIDSLSVLEEMTNEQKGILFDAIYRFNLGQDVELDFAMKLAFIPFKNQFKRDNELYNAMLLKQSENGRKGGRPLKNKGLEKTQTNPKNPPLFLETQKSLNDNDNDNDSDNVFTKNNTLDGFGNLLDDSEPKREANQEGRASTTINSTNAKKNEVDKGRRPAKRKNKQITDEGLAFSKWFSENTPMKNVTDASKKAWGEVYDTLIATGYSKSKIVSMCRWALSNEFWRKNFLSANKLLLKNKEGVPYHEVFSAHMEEATKSSQGNLVKAIHSDRPYNPTGAHNNER